MSATLGTFLKKLEPQWTMRIFERMDRVAMESSEAWNNAGTGHSAFCELNYTPQNTEGGVNISKAVKIAESFEVSKEFWASLVEKGIIGDPLEVIRHIPHISFVWGEEDTTFLRNRYAAMRLNALFSDMQYSEDPSVFEGVDAFGNGRTRCRRTSRWYTDGYWHGCEFWYAIAHDVE